MGIYKIRNEFGHHMKWVMAFLAFIFIVGAMFMFGSAPKMESAGGKAQDEVVATVGDMQISRGELNAAFDTLAENLKNQGVRSTLALAQGRGQQFQQMLDSLLTLSTANKLGVKMDDRAVTAKRDEFVVERLRGYRRSVMGKMGPAEDRLDPREDKDFRNELTKVNISLDDVIKQQEAFVPEAQVRQMLAQDGMRKALLAKAGTVTPSDVKNSYNVYNVRQISIAKGSLPADQLTTRVNKIVAEAKQGGDFAALGKKYSQDPSKGAVQAISYGTLDPGVWDRLTKMKPGEVADPIATPAAVFIVKLESVGSKLPAKFDQKAQDARRVQLTNQLMTAQYLKVRGEVEKTVSVKINDPEMDGYWQMSQVRVSGSNPAAMMQQVNRAVKSFEKAFAPPENNPYAGAMLAAMLSRQGKTKDAMSVLAKLLDAKDSRGTGADLRMLYGDMYMQTKDKDDAIKQYKLASEAASVQDADAHKELAKRFQKAGMADVVAQEQTKVTLAEDYKKKLDARQPKAAPGAPRRAPAPAKP